jgi:hypothetical protein
MSRLVATLGAVALVGAVAAEFWYYPQVATWIYVTFTGVKGWDGSALTYIAFFRVLPAALVFLTMFGLGLIIDSRGGSRVSLRIVVLGWVLNAVVLAISVMLCATFMAG